MMNFSRKKFLPLAAALFFCALACGCAAKLRYNLNPTDPYYYRCSSYRAGISGENVLDYTPSGDSIIKITPVMKRDSDTGIFEIETVNADRNGIPLNAGAFSSRFKGSPSSITPIKMRYALSSSGTILKDSIIGSTYVSNADSLYINLPARSIKKGDLWHNSRFEEFQVSVINKAPIMYTKAVEYKYVFKGKKRLSGESVYEIKATARDVKTSDIETPEGTKTLRVSYEGDQDIFFSVRRGIIKNSTFTRVVKYEIRDAVTNEINAQVGDASRLEYVLQPKKYKPGMQFIR